MPLGPGKYDAELLTLREKIGAEGAILIVFNAERGSGFSAQLQLHQLAIMPRLLRNLADELEKGGV